MKMDHSGPVSALQGSCVCAVTQTDGIGAFKTKQGKAVRWLLYETELNPSSDELIAEYKNKARSVQGIDEARLSRAELRWRTKPNKVHYRKKHHKALETAKRFYAFSTRWMVH